MRTLRLISTTAAILMLTAGVVSAQGIKTDETPGAPAAQQTAPAENMAPAVKSDQIKTEKTGQAAPPAPDNNQQATNKRTVGLRSTGTFIVQMRIAAVAANRSRASSRSNASPSNETAQRQLFFDMAHQSTLVPKAEIPHGQNAGRQLLDRPRRREAARCRLGPSIKRVGKTMPARSLAQVAFRIAL